LDSVKKQEAIEIVYPSLNFSNRKSKRPLTIPAINERMLAGQNDMMWQVR